MTTRLYYTHPWEREFDARVVDVVASGAGTSVYLDRSAFYPASGGQPCDLGTLNGARVTDVVEDADGRVCHLVEATLEVGTAVRGVIDWARRFDHMQQHTGQHVLSAAFERLHGARTDSFHLGTEASTIDLACSLTPAQVAAAETLANEVVWENRPVTIRFVSDDEAATLPLRKPPVRQGRLRVIEIAGFDLSACGGTHVSRLGEVGLIAVRAWERYKGGMRVTFECGGRALRSYRSFRDAVTGAVRTLSVFPHELPEAIARLQGQQKDLQRDLKHLRERLARHEAAVLAARSELVGHVRALLGAVDGHDTASLKTLASAVVASVPIVAVLVAEAPAPLIAAARHPEVTGCDCGELVRAVCAQFGGKGGGRPEMAQGGGMTGTGEAWLAHARAWLTEHC